MGKFRRLKSTTYNEFARMDSIESAEIEQIEDTISNEDENSYIGSESEARYEADFVETVKKDFLKSKHRNSLLQHLKTPPAPESVMQQNPVLRRFLSEKIPDRTSINIPNPTIKALKI